MIATRCSMPFKRAARDLATELLGESKQAKVVELTV